MSGCRYQLNGSWFRGNTHLHSLVSDGHKDYLELERIYQQAGYDFLCLTDHWVISEIARSQKHGLLWINGIELHGEDERGTMYHIACIGNFHGIDQTLTLDQAVQCAIDQGGFITLAHPFWSGNTLDDCFRYPFHAVEVFNFVCHCEIGKGDGTVYWNHMLQKNPNILGIACDDAHFNTQPPIWKGGWVMVNALKRNHDAILNALRTGNYYSSCGPEFLNLSFQDNQLQVETSPVRFIRLVGPDWRGTFRGTLDNRSITSAEFNIPMDWKFAYLEIEDHQGKRAWTNNLFGAGK